jgi:phosphoribosylamine--glycine ligase
VRILFVSRDFSGASLCLRLVREGNDVRAFVADPRYRQIMDGLVGKIDDLDAGIAWVGRDGLVVVDDVGFGELQDRLRGEGYAVVGGSAGGDRLELDRVHCQQVLADAGVRTVPIHHFDRREEAIAFLRAHPGRWVLKQNGNRDKSFCYVGRLDDGSDVLDLLEYYGRKDPDDASHFILQRHVDGVEIAVGRYFNGVDWVGPAELNIEHKHLFPGGLGPKTDEMGTLLWYDGGSDSRLFREVLAPLAPHLRRIDFRGPFDLNCIVNENGAFPLEATSRFGCPTTQLQMEFHISPWTEFLAAVARGEDYPLEVRAGYGVVMLVAIPPFPYCPCSPAEHPLPRGLKIHFREEPNVEELRHYHFEEVSGARDEGGRESYYTCTESGYVLHVSALGRSVEEAREAALGRAGNVVIPKMFYRNDIGEKFVQRDRTLLENWKYIPSIPCNKTP